MRRLAIGLVLCCSVIAGCSQDQEGTDIKFGLYSLFDPVAANSSLCGSPAIPFPNNALFSGFADPTLNIPNPTFVPFVIGANLTDGFSTVGSMFTDVLGAVDYDTAADAVVIFESAGLASRVLVHGEDYRIQPSIAMAQFSGTGHSSGTCTGIAPARFLPISQQRSRLLIEPLKPLKPSTTYIVAVTKDLKSTDGVAATPGDFFRVVNSDSKICDIPENDATLVDCDDPAAPNDAAARLNAPFLSTLLLSAAPTSANAKLTTLETLRSTLIRPTVQGLKTAIPTLTDDQLVIAWSFTTQSITNTLDNIEADPFSVPRTIGVQTSGMSTDQVNPALESYANVYFGSVSLPYFLNVPADGTIDPDAGGPATAVPAVLATYFDADDTVRDDSQGFLGGLVPCAAFAAAPSASTTLCFPRPMLRSDQTVPMIVTVPNSTAPNAGGSCGGRGTIAGSHASTPTCVAPAGGWPVVIFQHGITRNRTDMLALAPTLAAYGFVVVAIDLPLHGLVPENAATFPGCGVDAYNGFHTLGGSERTFAVDYVNNVTGAAGADTFADCSGTHFVNLSSLITSRDNLRQAESDLIHLAKSINGVAFDADGATDEINEAGLRFAGQSLGAIVGTTVLGVNTDFGAASLHVPGGGLGKLLDASASFGPRIAAGLSASFIFEGTDSYESFVRFAQHLVDPGDPINYAAAANENHALHVVKVNRDSVVPNSAASTCPAAEALPAGLGATATAVTAARTAAASGQAAAALMGLCPNLQNPANTPVPAFMYQDEVTIGGFLSGTDPLVDTMDLHTTVNMSIVPFASQTGISGDALVVFPTSTAEHGTLLSPNSRFIDGDGDGDFGDGDDATYAATPCEMQRQTAMFLLTSGASLPIGGSCP